ncbi:MAG: type pilus assembly protein PilO [Acidobacteriota bacterium]|jgi:type IV pilus assembly protein PilO|nr:type pilus assembly protein PilO [Acidobacteriota bacterium]
MLKLDDLQEKPWYVQLAIFGGVALVVYGAFWYLVTRSTRAETQEVETQVETLQRANAGAVVASQRLNEFKANYERAKADYDDLKLLLPEQRELTMVLQNVQERARGRLTLTKFSPQEEVQQDFYTGKPVAVAVTGNYNSLGQFFAQMASYQRIVSITDFKVTKLKDNNHSSDARANQTVTAEFLVTAYYVSPDKLDGAPSAGRAPGAPPAQTSAANAPSVQPSLTPAAASAPRVKSALSSPQALANSVQPPPTAIASVTGGHGGPIPPPGGTDGSTYMKGRE